MLGAAGNIASITARSWMDGWLSANTLGSLTMTGEKYKGSWIESADLGIDVNIDGLGVAAGKTALGTLNVPGTVSGNMTIGNTDPDNPIIANASKMTIGQLSGNIVVTGYLASSSFSQGMTLVMPDGEANGLLEVQGQAQNGVQKNSSLSNLGLSASFTVATWYATNANELYDTADLLGLDTVGSFAYTATFPGKTDKPTMNIAVSQDTIDTQDYYTSMVDQVGSSFQLGHTWYTANGRTNLSAWQCSNDAGDIDFTFSEPVGLPEYLQAKQLDTSSTSTTGLSAPGRWTSGTTRATPPPLRLTARARPS